MNGVTETVAFVENRLAQLMSTGAVQAKMPPAVAASTAPTPEDYAASASVMAEQPNVEVAQQVATQQTPTIPPAALYVLGVAVVLYLFSRGRR